MKAEFKKLDMLIDYLRSKGVSAYKGALGDAQVELLLLPDEPFKPEKERKKSVDEILEGKKKGADGLTAQQQEDLYGVILDAGP